MEEGKDGVFCLAIASLYFVVSLLAFLLLWVVWWWKRKMGKRESAIIEGWIPGFRSIWQSTGT